MTANDPAAVAVRPGASSGRAIGDSFAQARRRGTWRKNPVMFVVEVGSVLTTLLLAARPRRRRRRRGAAVVHRRGQRSGSGSRCCSPTSPRRWPRGAARRRRPRCARCARRPRRAGWSTAARSRSPASTLRKGDMVVVEAGELIPGDGEVIEGIASVDESAITGESAPVIRESGGDRSRGHRRHQGALRPDRRAHHRRTRASRSSTG